MRRAPEGIFVSNAGHVCVTRNGATIEFGLQPAELRGLAAEMIAAADRREAEAEAAASSALAKAAPRGRA